MELTFLLNVLLIWLFLSKIQPLLISFLFLFRRYKWIPYCFWPCIYFNKSIYLVISGLGECLSKGAPICSHVTLNAWLPIWLYLGHISYSSFSIIISSSFVSAAHFSLSKIVLRTISLDFSLANSLSLFLKYSS